MAGLWADGVMGRLVDKSKPLGALSRLSCLAAAVAPAPARTPAPVAAAVAASGEGVCILKGAGVSPFGGKLVGAGASA